MVERHDSGIPVMLEDCFCGEGFWAPFFNATRNLVIDTHVYYCKCFSTYRLEWPAIYLHESF